MLEYPSMLLSLIRSKIKSLSAAPSEGHDEERLRRVAYRAFERYKEEYVQSLSDTTPTTETDTVGEWKVQGTLEALGSPRIDDLIPARGEGRVRER